VASYSPRPALFQGVSLLEYSSQPYRIFRGMIQVSVHEEKCRLNATQGDILAALCLCAVGGEAGKRLELWGRRKGYFKHTSARGGQGVAETMVCKTSVCSSMAKNLRLSELPSEFMTPCFRVLPDRQLLLEYLSFQCKITAKQCTRALCRYPIPSHFTVLTRPD